MEPAGARLCVQMALESRKIWALQVVRSAAAGWRMAPPMALNGGQDGLVLLAGAERTAASCSAAQRSCFRILSDLQLHGIDELGFIHSTRADAVLLSQGVDEQRLMHAGAESALQARSCSRPIAFWSLFMV